MKFLAIFCLVALAAADDDTTQDKSQSVDNIQNTSTLPAQPTVLSGQGFLPSQFTNTFPTGTPISNLAFPGFNVQTGGNAQGVNTELFSAPGAGSIPVNTGISGTGLQFTGGIPANSGLQLTTGIPTTGAIPTFPTNRGVLPGNVVSGIQSSFPTTGNVFPAVNTIPSQFPAVNTIPAQFPAVNTIPAQFPAVNTIPAQFPAVNTIPAGLLQGVPSVQTGAIDPNTGAVSAPAFRFADGLSGIGAQGLQTTQQVGLTSIPAFTGGILPSYANAFQGQTLQQLLKNPAITTTGLPAGITTTQGLTTGTIPSGTLTFRQS